MGIKSITSQEFRNCVCRSITSFVRVLALLNLCLPQISGWSIQGSPWVVHSSSPRTRSIGVVHGLGVSEMYHPCLRFVLTSQLFDGVVNEIERYGKILILPTPIPSSLRLRLRHRFRSGKIGRCSGQEKSVHSPASGGPDAMDRDIKKSHIPNARARCSSRTAFNTSTLATAELAPSKKPNVMKQSSKLGKVVAKGQNKVEIPVTQRQTWQK